MANRKAPSTDSIAPATPRIRAIDPACEAEINLVAERMRLTLIEVEGEETGTALYTMDWLRERVRFHLDSAQCTARVFLSENAAGHITGHTIVRIETDEQGSRHGLFSTTYVEPESRRYGVAVELLLAGEHWMAQHRLPEAATWTSETNVKLIGLYAKHGYAVTQTHVHEVTQTRMVRLSKKLQGAA